MVRFARADAPFLPTSTPVRVGGPASGRWWWWWGGSNARGRRGGLRTSFLMRQISSPAARDFRSATARRSRKRQHARLARLEFKAPARTHARTHRQTDRQRVSSPVQNEADRGFNAASVVTEVNMFHFTRQQSLSLFS